MDAFDAFNTNTPQPLISTTTVFSLLAVCAILLSAYGASVALLPKSTSEKFRVLFIWHFFDASVHFLLEGAYLVNCFFTYRNLVPGAKSTSPLLTPMTAPGVSFLGQPHRLYGAFYGDGPTAKLWQEYAKADRRWGGSDLTVISLELLTVLVMAPGAAYVCYLLARQSRREVWFVATAVATGELYGGFMTFAPEWLTGSPNLDTGNFLFLWVYLVFMNMLWVVFPAWVLYEAYHAICAGGSPAVRRSGGARKSIAAAETPAAARARSPTGRKSVRAKKAA